MPFRAILDQLVDGTEGAVGAVFLDESGEIVHEVARGADSYDMRLVGAWVGIYIRQLNRLSETDDLGRVEILHTQNDRFQVFARPLQDGYSLVLMQQTPSISGATRRALLEAGERMIEEGLSLERSGSWPRDWTSPSVRSRSRSGARASGQSSSAA